MALRGALTQNIDKKDPAESSDYSFEQSERQESAQESFYEEKGTVCPKCRRKLSVNSRFCNYCGVSLTAKEADGYEESRGFPAADHNPAPAASLFSIPVPVSAPSTHSHIGINDLGALRSRYFCAYGILIVNIIFIAVGSAIIGWGAYVSQNSYVRLAAFFGYDPYGGLIPLGLFIVIICLIDLFIRKENCLEIYEYGIRGKGSVGWIGYHIKPFQFRFDEIISVENKAFALIPGVCITAGNGDIREIHIFIRRANDAVEEINSLRRL